MREGLLGRCRSRLGVRLVDCEGEFDLIGFLCLVALVPWSRKVQLARSFLRAFRAQKPRVLRWLSRQVSFNKSPLPLGRKTASPATTHHPHLPFRTFGHPPTGNLYRSSLKIINHTILYRSRASLFSSRSRVHSSYRSRLSCWTFWLPPLALSCF